MTDAAELPVINRWRVTMADNTERTIEARGFRVEHGALVLVQPHGCAAAYGRCRGSISTGPLLIQVVPNSSTFKIMANSDNAIVTNTFTGLTLAGTIIYPVS